MQTAPTTPENTIQPQPRQTKALTVTRLLARNRGATLTEIAAATAWQPHSCRSFLTGLRKKGSVILKECRKDGETFYRTEA